MLFSIMKMFMNFLIFIDKTFINFRIFLLNRLYINVDM